MNSSEQKEYEYITPTSKEVQETITLINSKLESLGADVAENESSKEGYKEAIRLMTENNISYDAIASSLKTDKSRAIAVLAVDYLNGECSREILLEFGSRQ